MNTLAKRVSPTKSWVNPNDHYKKSMGHPWYQAIAVLQDEIVHSTFQFFREQGIRSVCLPATTGSVTSPMGLGSDSLPVKIELEGVETYLADSMQFHLEYMLRYLDQGVHYVMPTFRGEDADARHLCQFYHSEAEVVGTLEDVMKLVSEYIHRLCVDILNNPESKKLVMEIAGTTEHIEKVVSQKGVYSTITLSEAILELENDPEYVSTHPVGFKTITNKGEQELIRRFGGLVWLTHHDYLSVPFYQARDKNGVAALNADLLFGIGEVVGCGERHTTGEELRESMEYHTVDEKEYEWYTYMKDHNPMKTSGFGMGMERFILFLLKHDDIRDIQIIPRFNGVAINP
ncbi:asparaginyl-tRNA synthetase [Croceifilum oryzae]|uniref:Asparaginyl-tRNA synthetase n=1 Tax=Croceifilum oryzae TaxID=1553429 RepID=A0AAJ1TJA4_9BACL|nr:asparagine synthetase A [Croceifilum oryzae]MDQ0417967.1 asparaginyl-tRNA synthetase [Croceifilum oryzae]